jgi:hypothetical protein
MGMGFLDRLKEMFGGGGGTRGPDVDVGPPEATTGDDPAVQSASAAQSPEEQTGTAAADPGGTIEPGTEGQDQEPR